jgi:hypothetical protein
MYAAEHGSVAQRGLTNGRALSALEQTVSLVGACSPSHVYWMVMKEA